ncbi:MAG: gamma-glutamyltransferase, partial [Chloroflexi bacterium]|nr:gamma-glutamyltransferase [Chloroflexota bacterium]
MTFFRSRRSSVVARNGAVATSQPLAAQVGLDILKQGGNAVDAAVATAAALNVLEPMSTGVGGDMFALVWKNDEKRVRALNGSGRAAAA